MWQGHLTERFLWMPRVHLYNRSPAIKTKRANRDLEPLWVRSSIRSSESLQEPQISWKHMENSFKEPTLLLAVSYASGHIGLANPRPHWVGGKSLAALPAEFEAQERTVANGSKRFGRKKERKKPKLVPVVFVYHSQKPTQHPKIFQDDPMMIIMISRYPCYRKLVRSDWYNIGANISNWPQNQKAQFSKYHGKPPYDQKHPKTTNIQQNKELLDHHRVCVLKKYCVSSFQ